MSRLIAIAIACFLGATPASAQLVFPSGGGGGGSGGSGTVTSIATGCQATGGTITTSGTIYTAETPTNLTSSATVTVAMCGGLEFFNSASDLTPTLPAADSGSFPSGTFIGWETELCNAGSHTQTLTPASGNINALGSTGATYSLPAASSGNWACVKIVSNNDATAGAANWDVVPFNLNSSGSGNALFGTTTGNTANNFVTMSNTTVGVKDSGTSWAAPSAIGSTTPAAGTFTTLTYGVGPAILTSPAAASMQLGAADAASPVAQTEKVQSVAGGTASTAGANWFKQASLSTGTGTAGLLNVMTGFASLSENATITATNASPAVITYTAHGLVPGASGQFSNSGGALPTGISAATTYYVCKDANLTTNTFDISQTFVNGACGPLINTSSTGSGTNTFTTNTTVQNPGSILVSYGPSAVLGSNTTAGVTISPYWNTSGNVDAALLVNVTAAASGGSALLFDAKYNGTSEFNVDRQGRLTANNSITGTALAAIVGANSVQTSYVQNTNSNTAAGQCWGVGNNTNLAEFSICTVGGGNVTKANGTYLQQAAGAYEIQSGGTAGSFNGTDIMDFGFTSAAAWTLNTATYASCTALTTNSSGTIGCTASDPRLKNIDPVPYVGGLANILKIIPITFRGRDGNPENVDTRHQAGFNCWNVRDSLPMGTHDDAKGYCNLDQNAIIAGLVNAVKQQQKEIEKLKRRVH
jgi:hypothetical protein